MIIFIFNYIYNEVTVTIGDHGILKFHTEVSRYEPRSVKQCTDENARLFKFIHGWKALNTNFGIETPLDSCAAVDGTWGSQAGFSKADLSLRVASVWVCRPMQLLG